jgi:endonuclease YncB( thermonuclease family)
MGICSSKSDNNNNNPIITQTEDIDIIRLLNNINKDNVTEYDLKNISGWCKVIDVYDGDTFKIIMPIDNVMKIINIRMYGIDTPELKSKNDEERKMAKSARDELNNMIYEKILWIKILKHDKYGGRYVGMIFTNKNDSEFDKSINKIMIDKGLAYFYDGKIKKKSFNDWN